MVAGARVAKGAPLFRLDDRAFVVGLALAEAGLAVAEADLLATEKSVGQQLAVVEQSRAAIESANADAVRADREYARTAQLASTGALTQRDFDLAESDERRARASVKSSVAGLSGAERRVDVIRAQIAQLRGKVDQAKAQVQKTKLDMDHTVVRAPVDGTVLQVHFRPGQYAEARGSDSSAVVVGNIDTLHVRVDIDEVDISRFRAGAAATISARGAASAKVPATYVRTEPLVVPKRSLTGAATERGQTGRLARIGRYPRSCFGATVRFAFWRQNG